MCASVPASLRGSGGAPEQVDVVVVGARCAGAPLATLLARAGLRVVVLEQATFPREVLTSHLMEADGLAFLDRLGVRDAVTATGVRFHRTVDTRLNDWHDRSRFPLRFDDPGGAAFVRRHLLDVVLAEEAARSGADVRMDHKVTELLWSGGRVAGVRVQHDGVEHDVRARLVVGADGRRSTVAFMVGARRYDVRPNERSYYFTFFEGADPRTDTFVFHRWGDRMVWSGPADGGLYLVGVSPERHERDYFRTSTREGLLAHLRRCRPTAEVLADATIATPIAGIQSFEGYFREATGPGWVLAGDSGHFKDPSLGRGIGDAFMQVERLAAVVLAGFGGADDLDLLLRHWWAWRDAEFDGHYHLAWTLGRAGALPDVITQAVRRLERAGRLATFYDLFSHRARFDDVFPPAEMGRSTWDLLRTGAAPRFTAVRDALTLLSFEPGRRLRRWRPVLEPPELDKAPPVRGRPEPPRLAPASAGGRS